MHSLSQQPACSVPIMLKFPGMTLEPPDDPVLPEHTSDESDICWAAIQNQTTTTASAKTARPTGTPRWVHD
jgi:hypothetical protein